MTPQLTGFTYRTGLVPIVRITFRAMRLCKLQCSTAIAAMRPPAQQLVTTGKQKSHSTRSMVLLKTQPNVHTDFSIKGLANFTKNSFSTTMYKKSKNQNMLI
jgi:hypothetical protein